MNDMLVVLTNVPDQQTALALAERLVSCRAAACVNCLPAVQSIYHWKGQIEYATEVTLTIKAPRDQYPALEKLIKEVHPYEVPEIIALPIVAGLPAYLQWIQSETT